VGCHSPAPSERVIGCMIASSAGPNCDRPGRAAPSDRAGLSRRPPGGRRPRGRNLGFARGRRSFGRDWGSRPGSLADPCGPLKCDLGCRTRPLGRGPGWTVSGNSGGACARPRPCWQGRRAAVGGEPGLANLRPRRTRSSSASGLLALKAVLLAAHRVVRSPDTSRASHVGLKSALGRVGCWSGARPQGSGPPP
jgi:hypothetical protein